VRPEKIRLLGEQEADAADAAGIVREVAYLGSVTRYVVELDSGETLVVVRQNLDMSAARALQQRGRRVRLAWRRADESELDINQGEGSDR
jgi:putative spermidine/putrescine transport system ATP-binding protein